MSVASIYLTGAVSDWDDPFAWHDELVDEWPEHDFINPYTLNDFDLGDDEVYERPHEVVEPAEAAIESADGLLVYWDDDAFLVGSAMEVKHADDHGIPVVIWYDGWRDNLSPWLLDKSKGVFETKEKALKVLLAFTGDTNAIL